jgi:hypothetical protein
MHSARPYFESDIGEAIRRFGDTTAFGVGGERSSVIGIR